MTMYYSMDCSTRPGRLNLKIKNIYVGFSKSKNVIVLCIFRPCIMTSDVASEKSLPMTCSVQVLAEVIFRHGRIVVSDRTRLWLKL
jgi:hypothetical protein